MRHDPGVTRRTGLIASGIASVLLLLAMSPADNRMKDTGGPGVIPFELTGGQDRADEIMAEWGEDGKDAARESLWIDFGFLIAYGTFLTLALRATRGAAAPLAATIFASLKFLCLAASIAYLLAALATLLLGRRSAEQTT